ncbi:MAG: hypothetical protein A2275_06975 [Bacteroidetes bacterium RIFOXYA12_FULL_35_11]|nr:MAG: hypothetical protein A2X01_01290 [Bacteroidetes bacterium GWF2_35_48]OFY83177.1 MAG: hypothetical protein A2275_06975 [Bacteroidetes bacterium RIFOXYA12_FULL_35_11]OFY97353.1 MAG: hypothetical protein A2491_21210 [Bacteroidetes bacterium RIFOXYC12_FULL_35_7]HBX51211.1 diacylglycerol kinase [Bacteroidales bacterium]
MSSTRYFLIINPGSKGGKSQNKIDKILTFFKEKNLQFEYAITKNLDDAYDLSVKANQNGFDIIVAVGGDGTINRVLNGFYDKEGIKISNAIFAVIYTGTSPDFCKSYNIPIHLNAALDAIYQNKTRNIPIGKILLCKNKNFQNIGCAIEEVPASETEVNYFACCVNIGLGAATASMANSGIRKYLGDAVGTFISLISAIIKYKPSDFIFEQDGEKKHIEKLFNLSAGITRFIASGIKVNHDLQQDDRHFYNLTIKKLNLLNLPKALYSVYSGKKIKKSKIIELTYCTSLSIKGNPNAAVEFDGDPYGFLPCKIELADDNLKVVSL